MSGDLPRVLFARPDHLGDLLITLPAIRAVRRSFPAARISWLVPPGLSSIGECATDVDEVLAASFALGEHPPVPGSSAVAAAAAALRGRFDLAILPRPSDPWSGPPIAAAGVPLRVGRPHPATMPFLSHAYEEAPSRHVSREGVVLALRAIRLLAARTRSRQPVRQPLMRLREADRAAAAKLLTELGIRSSPPIVVHPTAGWPLKSWPLEWWARVVGELGRRLRSPVLVAGPARDRRLLEEIVARAPASAQAVADVALPTLAALHARSRAVVGIDSGALHLAAVVGTPVVGLFGPFGPRRFGPIASPDRFRAVFRVLPCSPCGTLEAPPCGAAREPACFTAIDPGNVIGATLELVTSVRR